MGLAIGEAERSERSEEFKLSAACLILGLVLILAYWYAIHPLDFARGYTEDWCQPDMTRQLMSEALDKTGGPSFHSDAYRAPVGMAMPYMSWGIEVSWLGAYFWKWSRDFPFLWLQFGLSLVGSYLGVGWILRKMKLRATAAWGLALAVVLFHIPRHFKIWHHYEHVLQHWVYWSFFLDAWIWQRFWRERRWSWSLEAWRGLCLLGMLTTAGYFWGPLILEWCLVRVCMAGLWGGRWLRGERDGENTLEQGKLTIEGSWRQAWPVAVIGLFLAIIDYRWFGPLAEAARGLGGIPQQLGWFGHWPYMIRPLWLDDLSAAVRALTGQVLVQRPFNNSETVITPGWFLILPALFGLWRVAKTRGFKAALGVALPFVLLLGIAILYFNQDPPRIAPILQAVVPFMSFFRVATRWGLFLPQLLGVVIALGWPELREWVSEGRRLRPRRVGIWLAVFALSTLAEFAVIRAPVSTMPKLSESAASLLEGVRTSPGTTVLDLPFCLTGGNGICGAEQCPNYPESTTGSCFRGWHDKNVYGIYSGRLAPEQCETYHQAPYLSWFDAWRTQRCFTEAEWADFCVYLGAHPELSAILLYPDIWRGAGTAGCLAQFETHLGAPIASAEFVIRAIRGAEVPRFSRLMRFAPRCVR